MKAFQERIETLRHELIRSIVNILADNGLQRLELSENLENPTYVVWHEPQEGVFYDTPVFAVSIYKDGVALEVEESENGFMETLYSVRGDLACMHLDWLNGLREDILETIKLQQNGD
ncbi:MAG: hypothetical protein LBB85_09185 [Dysgonamonadaceae bacterium]|jgi:hypothetical protein|nr:hypothetical protein [Dysgonamonadaceae bacterium]